MDLALNGKRVLITGGSKGIGLACAEAFAEAGCDLVLVSRDGAKLAAAADALRVKAQVNIRTFAADLATDEGREKLHAAHPDPDILVNNAGAIPGGRLADIPMPRWRQASSPTTGLALGPWSAAKPRVVRCCCRRARRP